MKTMPPEPAGATVDLGRFIHDFIEDFLASHDNNNLGSDSQARAWDGFLLGFSSGADDLYQFFKTHIGDFHWTPAEAFALGMAPGQAPDEIAPPPALAPATIVPAAVVPAGELTVVSWALCHTEETRAANRSQTRWPSEPWARARIYGQRCSRALHKAVLEALDSQGYRAVAPAPSVRTERIARIWRGLPVVRAARSLRLRPGNLRVVRRADHRTGQGAPPRFARASGAHRTHSAPLQRPLRVLSALRDRRLHRVRRSLPRGLH
jgi:hypothetical protein